MAAFQVSTYGRFWVSTEASCGADGVFDLAVNGGGVLTLCHEREGFIPVWRTLELPWCDFVVAPDVVMIPHDPAATVVELGPVMLASADPLILAQAATGYQVVRGQQGLLTRFERPGGGAWAFQHDALGRLIHPSADCCHG